MVGELESLDSLEVLLLSLIRFIAKPDDTSTLNRGLKQNTSLFLIIFRFVEDGILHYIILLVRPFLDTACYNGMQKYTFLMTILRLGHTRELPMTLLVKVYVCCCCVYSSLSAISCSEMFNLMIFLPFSIDCFHLRQVILIKYLEY